MEAITRPRSQPADPQEFKVVARPSSVDGYGAFADEKIPPKRKIGEIRGEAISVREARRRAKALERIVIIEVSERRANDASASPDQLRFANHSCSANASLRIRQGRVEIYSVRPLAAGDEITLDYGETHHNGRLACRCGSSRCRGAL